MNRDRCDIVVIVKGIRVRAKLIDMVKREIATALANVGAFEVTTSGDFAGNATPRGCAPWLRRQLAA
jgi:hypothetical protein